MTQYKTPNVYIEEISSFPPSVVAGATAVPAFIGYTEKAGNKTGDTYEYHNKPVRITSMVEYENLFGKAYFSNSLFNIDLGQKKNDRVRVEANPAELKFLLYYQLQMYFSNGGGVCYIVSVGQYGDDKEIKLKKDAIKNGLDALQKEDEPTLIMLTDAVNLGEDDYYEICQQALKQCKELKDRFVIFDIPGEIKNFRTKIGQNNLQYGAAYYPYLNTNLSYFYEDKKIADIKSPLYFVDIKDEKGNPALRIKLRYPEVEINELQIPNQESNVTSTTPGKGNESSVERITFAIVSQTLKISVPGNGATVSEIIEAWKTWTGTKGSFDLRGETDDKTSVPLTSRVIKLDTIALKSPKTLELSGKIETLEIIYSSAVPQLVTNKGLEKVIITGNKIEIGSQMTIGKIYEDLTAASSNSKLFSIERLDSANDNIKADIKQGAFTLPTLETMKTLDSKLYFETKGELDKLRVTLPPSGAIAGVYASVDRDRGVWKAPANVSINAVIEPKIKITDAEQENLNVHDSGKSINVIRSFTGKGTLVWGSRTLAGNDNEWRYVPVRRLFNLIEKSIKSSTSFAVFEPNTEMTWLKVRVMIENYLNELWSQGALAGSKAEEAYFVQVGLGKTMTSQDILEGKMITKIGIAAVRPAEFIIMHFSHLLQKS